MYALLLFVVANSLVSLSNGEVQFVCPPTLSGSEYTELTSGPRTIIFRETNMRQGSPFRLSLYRFTNQECVLLDHIPYQSDSNDYYITVDIPDVTCSPAQNCRLVLRQIDTLSNGYCQYDSCPQYNSTALISIRRSSGNSFSCPNRRAPSLVYYWPYDPSRRYTANLQSSSSSARANGVFVLVGDTLLYNVTMTTPFKAKALRFLYYPLTERVEILTTINIDGTINWYAGSWRLTSITKQLFISGQLYVDIVNSTSTEGDVIGQITQSTNVAIVNDLYGQEYGSYTNGWLVNNPFTGPSANATFFAKPVGPCLNNTRYFGCMFTTSVTNSGGTIALSITGNRMVFAMDMYNVSTINIINLLGTATDTIELITYWSDGLRANGVLDISTEQSNRIIAGLSSVEVTSRNGQLKCDLQEGIISFLDSGLEKPALTTPTNGSATGFMSFSVSGDVNIQVTLNDLTSPLIKAHLHGPAYQGITTTSIPFDMSTYIEGQNGSSWNVRASFRNVSAAELRYFIEGLYYLNMHTVANPTGELRGQASIIGEWVCPLTGALTNQCKFVWLPLVDGVRINSSLIPTGIGAVVIDRIQRIQFSLAFWNVPSSMSLQVMLTSPNGVIITVNTQTSPNRANIQEANAYFPTNFDQVLSESDFNFALQGQLAINVTTPTYPSGYMYSMIRSIQRNRCDEDSYLITVGGDSGWSQGQSYPSLRILENDILNFTFSAPDTVFLMENRNRYDGCVFSTATLLSNTPGIYRYIVINLGTQYFASQSSCQAQTPMKFPAYVIAGVTNGLIDSNTCSKSLYSYSADQRLLSADSSSTSTIAASVAGLVIGMVLVVVVIVVMVILVARRQVNGHSVDLPAKA